MIFMMTIIIDIILENQLCYGERPYKLGCKKFVELIDSAAFVDKTLLIKEFFQHKFVFISAPHCFGKTINMDMVKTFCEIQMSKNGTMVPIEKSKSFSIFSKKKLNIYNNRTYFNQRFGRFPVIHLDFNLLTGKSFDSFLESFRELVSVELLRHDYLLDSRNLSAVENGYLKRLHQKIVDSKLSVTESKTCMSFLSKILHLHFHRKIVLLVDGFDHPVEDAIFTGGKNSYEIIEFLKEFVMKLLKLNRYFGRALINSCIMPWRVSQRETAIGFKYFSFTDSHPFNKYYGFTEEEVFNSARRCLAFSKIKEIQFWYDGYNIAGRKRRLYNGLSVISFLNSRKAGNYWVKSVGVPNLERLLLNKHIRVEMVPLVRGMPRTILCWDGIGKKEINTLIRVMNASETSILGKWEVNLFLNLMLDMGCFTLIKKQGNKLTLKIPNNEIKSVFRNYTYSLEYFKNTLKLTEKEITGYVNSILTVEQNSSSYVEFAKRTSDLFTNAKIPDNEEEILEVLTVFPRASNQFECVLNGAKIRTKEVDIKGRYMNKIDILIIRKDGLGIILEVGCKGNVRGRKKSYFALQHILELKYYNVFNDELYKAKNKLMLGLAFKEDVAGLTCYVTGLFNSVDVTNSVTVTS